jgi:uncharacterized phosphosugar-binding protein
MQQNFLVVAAAVAAVKKINLFTCGFSDTFLKKLCRKAASVVAFSLV